MGGGGRRGPIYRENEPLFRRKRLQNTILGGVESMAIQRAAEETGVSHFFLFRSPFRNHFVAFVTFCAFFDVFGHFFAYPLCLPLMRQREQ